MSTEASLLAARTSSTSSAAVWAGAQQPPPAYTAGSRRQPGNVDTDPLALESLSLSIALAKQSLAAMLGIAPAEPPAQQQTRTQQPQTEPAKEAQKSAGAQEHTTPFICRWRHCLACAACGWVPCGLADAAAEGTAAGQQRDAETSIPRLQAMSARKAGAP
eukprot:m51a1_g8065 hypothetical protein (161) ;mRNA; r:149418-149900